jgi:hypothetical protein
MEEKESVFRLDWLVRIYDRTILQYPWFFVLAAFGAFIFFGFYIKNFSLDASSESIVLENDSDLRYYSQTREIFGSDDYIFVTVTPPEGTDLFSDKVVNSIEAMSKEFTAMPDVESVTSILNVPLFHSPEVQFFQMASQYKTILTGADRALARKELTESPLYKDYLIASDAKTTTIQVTFKDPPQAYTDTYNRRRDLRDERLASGLTPGESAELARLEEEYAKQHVIEIEQNRVNIEKSREIVNKYRAEIGEMHLGGVPMIIADIIHYVRSDIRIFGVASFVLVVITLGLLFRRVKWVLLPMLCCAMVLVIMMGYMGFTAWTGTIVTSNFPAMLIVITLVTAVHIVAHFQELFARNPAWTNRQLTLQTVRDLSIPCLATSLTTVVGFGSLLVSGIRPLIDLGLIVSAGIMVAYVLLFTFIPAAMQYFPLGAVPKNELSQLNDSPMRVYARFTERHGILIYVLLVVIVAGGGFGISKLKVENRFIDYFRENTEIYKGMSVIDQRLGGTTPLEVVLEAKGKDFWIEKENLAKLREIHEWIDAQPESGKVISPDTLMRMAEGVYDVGKNGPIPTPLLKVMLKAVPKDLQDAVVGPYLTPERDQVRIALRVEESSKSLSRKGLMQRFDEYFKTAPVFKDGTIKPRVTGIFVLYNNLLQSLYNSQIKTIAVSYGVIWVMFVVLFRSPTLATIAFLPNVPPVMITLGLMGVAGIPLNVLTIMIAGVSLGEAVDFALHYIHRFRHEYHADHDYKAAMYRCHNSIGRAMYYTTITTVVGFAIVCFSNFIPNVYFGLFTALALAVAFFASMTLLPLLIITLKPFGPDAAKANSKPEKAAA